MLASLVTRGVRFMLVAGLLWRFGPIQDFLEKRLPLVAGAFAVVFLGGIIALKYL